MTTEEVPLDPKVGYGPQERQICKNLTSYLNKKIEKK